jgi:hypothetical protein
MRRLHIVRSTPDPHPGLNTRAPIGPAVQSLLEHVRIIVPLPAVVRARALARARAVIGMAAVREASRSRSR